MRHLLEKNNRFYYRRKIPKCLHTVFGMQEFCATLETGNKREASIIESKFSPIFDAVVISTKKKIFEGLSTDRNDDIGRYLNRKLYSIIHPDRSDLELDVLFSVSKKPDCLLTMQEYVDDFLAYVEKVKKIKSTTYVMYESTLNLFVKQLGVTYITEINANNLNDFDLYLRSENKASTIKQKYTILTTFFKYLKKNKPELAGVSDLLDFISELRGNAPETVVERASFTDEEIRSLFNENYARICKKEEYYFIGLLSFCLGLRPMELIENIRIGDIKKGTDNGEFFIYFDLVDRKNEIQQSSLKTSQSARRIPLSRKLPFFKEFLDFYGRRKAASGTEALLFTHSLWATKDKMRQILKRSGVKSDGKVFYSLRHNYTQILRDSNLHPYVIDYLTGHKGAGITQTEYARNFDIRRLYQEIKKCDPIFTTLLSGLKLYALEFTVDLDSYFEAIKKFIDDAPKMDELLSEDDYNKYLEYNESHNFLIESEPEKFAGSTVDELIDGMFD